MRVGDQQERERGKKSGAAPTCVHLCTCASVLDFVTLIHHFIYLNLPLDRCRIRSDVLGKRWFCCALGDVHVFQSSNE